jgi:hypothetical protein
VKALTSELSLLSESVNLKEFSSEKVSYSSMNFQTYHCLEGFLEHLRFLVVAGVVASDASLVLVSLSVSSSSALHRICWL